MNASSFLGEPEMLLRTAVMTVLAYPLMLLMVRLSGPRTLAQMNAFDLIVAVALGSLLSNVITSNDLPLAQGMLGVALLILMQYFVAWLTTRFSAVEHAVNGDPILVVLRGELLHDAMQKARLTNEEIESALRAAGLCGLDQVEVVVLETNGSLSVVRKQPNAAPTALRVLHGYDR